MNVLFVSVQKNFSIIGPKLLHQILLKEGFNSNILYINGFSNNDSKSLDSLKGYIKDLSPAWIGVSLTSAEYKYARDFSLFIKKHFDFPIIWGGVEPTSTPEHCLPYADYVCIGEGEKATLDISYALKNGEKLENINNLAYKDGNEIHRNPLNPLVENMDDLPYIPRVATNSFFLNKGKVVELTHSLVKRNTVLSASWYRVINSRGCPMSCTFCVNSFYYNLYPEYHFRTASPSHIIEEITRGLQEPLPVAVISFLDENFFARKKKDLDEFFSLYKKHINIPYIVYSSPNYITDENLEKAIDTGLRGVQIGLQSGSERVCKEIYRRPISINKFLENVERVKKYKLIPNIEVICDNPYETIEDELATIDVLCKIPKPYFFYLLSLTFFEGTPIRERVKEEKPEALNDPHIKDLLITKTTVLNRLKHLSAIFPSRIVLFFSRWYKKNPNSKMLKILVEICFGFALIFVQPFIFLWILFLFSKKSIKQMIKLLYYFVDFRIFKTFNFWRTSKDTTQT